METISQGTEIWNEVAKRVTLSHYDPLAAAAEVSCPSGSPAWEEHAEHVAHRVKPPVALFPRIDKSRKA